MSVEVEMEHGSVRLAPGESMPFGRADGAGTVGGDDRRVSRHHGEVIANDRTWSALSLSDRLGFVVYDQETPSRLHIPRGVGPVEVPFAQSFVVIEVRDRRHAFSVRATGTEGWGGSWSSVLRQDAPASVPGATQLPWDGVRGRDRHGRPLRWFQTLVALCEPQLGDPPEQRIPTDAELARRIGTTERYVGSHLISKVREALAFPEHTPHLRQAMVAVALSQGLVTPADLHVLDAADPN